MSILIRKQKIRIVKQIISNSQHLQAIQTKSNGKKEGTKIEEGAHAERKRFVRILLIKIV